MAAYGRSDPGKLARDREAITRSRESMNHPDHPAFEGIRNLFTNLGKKLRSNANRAVMNRDYGAPYGSMPSRSGAEVQGQSNEADVFGSTVTGFRKRKSIA